MPLFSQIYEGNQSEPATLKGILARMGSAGTGLFEGQKPTLSMDRGIATAANLVFMEQHGYPYLVIERRDAAKDHEPEFETAPDGFQWVSGEAEGERVYVRKVAAKAKATEPLAEDLEVVERSVPTALLLCYS